MNVLKTVLKNVAHGTLSIWKYTPNKNNEKKKLENLSKPRGKRRVKISWKLELDDFHKLYFFLQLSEASLHPRHIFLFLPLQRGWLCCVQTISATVFWSYPIVLGKQSDRISLSLARTILHIAMERYVATTAHSPSAPPWEIGGEG